MKRFLIILLLLVLVTSCNKKEEQEEKQEYQDVPYTEITYEGDNGWACLTFHKNGEYSMYDCDSEPTDYIFDSENECTYNYNEKNKKVYFKCKYKKDNDIKIVDWTKEKIVFMYKGKEKTFYAQND